MRLNYLFIFFCLCVLPGKFSYSQTISDTLNKAKQLRAQGNIHKSFSLLKSAYKHHPDNLNVAWLTAQTAFWANRIRQSKHLYTRTIKANPKNLYLQLDYAKMLVNTGDFHVASSLLNNYLAYDSTNAQALTALSRIFFWKSKYHEAALLVNKAMKYDPKYPDAPTLSKEIALARSPYLKFSAGYGTDNQPMTTVSSMLGAGFYFSALSSLHFSFQSPFFIRDGKTSNAFIFQAGNTSFVSNANLTFGLDAGVVKLPYKTNYTWTGNLYLDQVFIRHLEISVSAQRNPYFSTLSSIDTIVIQNHLSASIGWNNMNNWNGQIAAEALTYPFDHNLTYTAYGWIFGPPVKFSVFKLQIGYGYNYSNSQKSRFVSEKSLSEIISGYDANTAIAGVYNPYYTPKDQQIHSFLVAFSGHLLKWLDLSLSANAGFLATAQVPYLYLDKNTLDSTVLKTGFVSERFFPLTLHLQAMIKISERIHFQADYTYMKTYFYTSNYAGIGINIRFPDEKKS